jgi:hypothetical protein
MVEQNSSPHDIKEEEKIEQWKWDKIHLGHTSNVILPPTGPPLPRFHHIPVISSQLESMKRKYIDYLRALSIHQIPQCPQGDK